MDAFSYHFVTRWRVPGTPEQVYAILEDVPRVVRFWPQLYRSAVVTAPGDGIRGKTVAVETKGFLPYVLRWNFRVTESHRPDGFSIQAWGDLTGNGCWVFMQEGAETVITYEWSVRAYKPLLRYFSFILRPLFALNHNWVMERGREGLLHELAAKSPAERKDVA